VQAAAFYTEHLAAPTKFAGAILRGPCVHLGKKITILWKLIEQLSDARPNAQKAFSAEFLSGQLAADDRPVILSLA